MLSIKKKVTKAMRTIGRNLAISTSLVIPSALAMQGCGQELETLINQESVEEGFSETFEDGYGGTYALRSVYEEKGHKIPVYSDSDNTPVDTILSTLWLLELPEKILGSGVKIVYSASGEFSPNASADFTAKGNMVRIDAEKYDYGVFPTVLEHELLHACHFIVDPDNFFKPVDEIEEGFTLDYVMLNKEGGMEYGMLSSDSRYWDEGNEGLSWFDDIPWPRNDYTRAKNGFFRPYGSTNLLEDVATAATPLTLLYTLEGSANDDGWDQPNGFQEGYFFGAFANFEKEELDILHNKLDLLYAQGCISNEQYERVEWVEGIAQELFELGNGIMNNHELVSVVNDADFNRDEETFGPYVVNSITSTEADNLNQRLGLLNELGLFSPENLDVVIEYIRELSE